LRGCVTALGLSAGEAMPMLNTITFIKAIPYACSQAPTSRDVAFVSLSDTCPEAMCRVLAPDNKKKSGPKAA